MIGVVTLIALLTQVGTAHGATSSPWTIISSPNEGSGNNRLAGVACDSSTSCVAVGYYLDSSGLSQSLAESWNGDAWSITPSPNKGNDADVLNGVSCSGITSCEAVGDYGDSLGDVKTLIESWNGSTWSITRSPNPSKTFDYLTGVTCTSSTQCFAVGDIGVDYSKTLVESWNGTAWSVIASPSPSGEGSALNGVSCVSPSDCVAVGTFESSTGKHGTLVESWNGTRWSVTPSPNMASDSLSGVSCTRPTSCQAVGNYFHLGRAITLIESWNGIAWSILSSPSSNKSTIVSLDAVSCNRSASCTAVGSNDKSLVESWDGTKWSVAPSPNQGDGDWLNDVSCIRASGCMTIGFYTNAVGTDKTLIEANYS